VSYAFWGICDGTSPWDQNTPGAEGYACLDQVGHFFTANQGGSNRLEGVYEWSNTLNGRDLDWSVSNGPGCARHFDHVVIGRDVFNDTQKPSYAPYTYPHPMRSLP
jgi:hypothetical protein